MLYHKFNKMCPAKGASKLMFCNKCGAASNITAENNPNAFSEFGKGKRKNRWATIVSVLTALTIMLTACSSSMKESEPTGSANTHVTDSSGTEATTTTEVNAEPSSAQLAMVDYLGKTFGDLVHWYGDQCELAQSLGLIPIDDPSATDRFVYYSKDTVPFTFLVSVEERDAPLRPQDSDKITWVIFSPTGDNDYPINDVLDTGMTFGEVKAVAQGKRLQFIETIYSYVIEEYVEDQNTYLDIEFVYDGKIPTAETAASEIRVSFSDFSWENTPDDW